MKKSMDLLDIHIAFKHAFPNTIQKSAAITAALLASAKGEPDIIERLKADKQYAKDFGSVVRILI